MAFAGSTSKNKGAYEIKIKIKGLSNEKVLLAYRFTDKTYIQDTLMLDASGTVVVSGTKPLNRGVYMFVVPSMNNNYFEFLVSDNPYFTLETDKADLNRSMKVTGSKENELFFADLLYMSDVRVKADDYSLKSRSENTDTSKIYKSKLDLLDKEVRMYRTNLIKSNPGMMYAKILNALQEREPAVVPRNPDGSAVDTDFLYKDYKMHYWDNIDFSEEGLLRSPIYGNKFDNYFDKVVTQIPDSLIKECDFVLNKARANSEIFKYSLVTLVNKFATNKVICMDAVYVHIVLNYYAKGDAPWVDSTSLTKMKMEANKKLPVLCDKIAPNLVLPDTTGKNTISLYDIRSKYTLVVFWDPDCGHCKKEIPQLAEKYKALKSKGVTIYAVSAIPEEEIGKWKDFIKTHNCDFINVADHWGYRTLYDVQSTPYIYILDQSKKIIAKHIGVEQIDDFISRYEEVQYKLNKK